jgi:hypothetical protein
MTIEGGRRRRRFALGDGAAGMTDYTAITGLSG